MSKISTFCFVVCLLLCSCTSRPASVATTPGSASGHVPSINVAAAMENKTILKASDLGKTIRYVPLETTAESVIGVYPDIRVCRDKILVASRQRRTMLVFDRQTGKYLNTIGKIGEGPMEYMANSSLNSFTFWVDESDSCDVVYFAASGRGIVKYKTDGSYIGRINIPQEVSVILSTFCNLAFTSQIIMFRNENEHTASNGNLQAVSNKADDTVYRAFPRQFSSPPSDWEVVGDGDYLFGAFIPYGCENITTYRYSNNKTYQYSRGDKPSIWGMNDSIRLKEEFSDTIYTVTPEGNTPYLAFEMGKWKWPYEKRFDDEESPKRIHIDYILEGTQKLYFHFIRNRYSYIPKQRISHCGIYDKLTGETKIMDSDKFENDINGLPSFFIRRTNSHGTFYGLIEAPRLIEWFEKNPDAGDKTQREILERVKEEDNPVVVIIE